MHAERCSPLMKILPLFICMVFSFCSGLNKNGLKRVLNNNSFEWHITTPDSLIVHRMHFLQDSIYVVVFKDPYDTSNSSPGYWHVKGGLLSASLWLANRITPSESELKLRSYHDGVLNFTYKTDHFDRGRKHEYKLDEVKQNRYKAIPLKEAKEPDITPYLLGSWYDPTDSIFASFSDYNRTGKVLGNPTFTFTKDSFNIRTENFNTKGIYRIINSSPDVIILESKLFFQNQMTIDVDYIDSAEIRARFDKNYRLKRPGP